MRCAALASLIVAASLSAAEAADCFSLATQFDIDQCVGAGQTKADAQLNALYAQIQFRLKGDPDTAKLLTVAQRAWLGYRDAECAFSAAATKGGTIHPMVVTLCTTRLTENRITDFKTYLACKEGDTACPVPAR